MTASVGKGKPDMTIRAPWCHPALAAGAARIDWLVRGYAEPLGHTADHTVARLTDLAPLLKRIGR